MVTYLIDIDNTIIFSKVECCEYCGGEKYVEEKIDHKEIALINKRHGAGDQIVIFTGRPQEQYWVTIEQLKRCGVKYDRLIMGKPRGIIIDKEARTTIE